MPILRTLLGPHQGAVYRLRPDKTTIGRGEHNAICLADERASGEHAVLQMESDGVELRDLGSTNGTFVDGKRVDSIRLSGGEKILIGDCLFEFVLHREARAGLPNGTVRYTVGHEDFLSLLDQKQLYSEPVIGSEGAQLLCELARSLMAATTTEGLLDCFFARLANGLGAASGCLAAPDDQGALLVRDARPRGNRERWRVPDIPDSMFSQMRALILDEPVRSVHKHSGAQADEGEFASVLYVFVSYPAGPAALLLLQRPLTEPFTPMEARLASLAADLASAMLDGIRKREETETEKELLMKRLASQYNIVGESPGIARVLDLIERMAPTDVTVLIEGETGAGKELIARALHTRSRRAAQPFVAVNCAAIPNEIADSELFGHEQGAFTGAQQSHKGYFEQAHGGTLFLDEISELPLSSQARLLRVLEQSEIQRIGGEKSVAVDVRILAASNINLQAAADRGQFRGDLYHRLSVLQILAPPLRARKDDIPLLAFHFLNQFCREQGLPPRNLSREALEELKLRSWPGNVRELRNTLLRAVVLCEGDTIEQADLDDRPGHSATPSGEGEHGPSTLRDAEMRHIRTVLESVDWHKGKAADVLGIDRKTLYAKCKQYGLQAVEQ